MLLACIVAASIAEPMFGAGADEEAYPKELLRFQPKYYGHDMSAAGSQQVSHVALEPLETAAGQLIAPYTYVYTL